MSWYKIAKFGDTVKQKYLAQGIDANIIDNYITKFDLIRKRKDKELFADIPNLNVPKNQRNDITAYKDFHDLEKVVDYVKGQKQVDPTKSSESTVAPIHQDNNLSIYRGSSPQECMAIRGGYPYTWCIAALGSNNMYNTYRYKPNEPTFYFVKSNNTPVEDKYHFFVIQVDNQGNYIVTSAKNDGDKQMSWGQISKINPALASLQGIFKNIPLSPKERENYNKFRRGLNDSSFAQLSYEDKKMYLDTVGHQSLSAGQFESLPDDLKSHYISFGIGLDYYKSKVIKDNQPLLKRYKQITERKVDALINDNVNHIDFKPSELEILDEDKKKILINNVSERKLDDIITTPGATMDESDGLLISVAKYKTNMTNFTVYSLLAYCNDFEEIAKILGQEKLNLLTDRNIFNLLDSHNMDIPKTKIAQILGQENINKLSDNSVSELIRSAEGSTDEIAGIIMTKGINLSNGDIYFLLKYSHNPTEIAERILQYKGPNLASSNVSHILENTRIDHSNDQFAKKIIQYKGNSLTEDDVFHILSYAKNLPEMARLLGQDNLNKLPSDLIYPLLVSNRNGGGNRIVEMANILGQENINRIPGKDIFHLLRLRNEEDRKAIHEIMVNHPAYQEQLASLKKHQPETARSLEQNIPTTPVNTSTPVTPVTPVTANRLFSSKFNDNYIGKL